MAKRGSTERNEVGMMSDLKGIAEAVGEEILGFKIDWVVETTAVQIGKRPDVEIRRQDGNRELLISGEAKRPETALGVHPFVASEVNGAVAKAKSLGGSLAFTTNFLSIAIFDVTNHSNDDYLKSFVGEEIAWIDEQEAASHSWWKDLTTERRNALVRPGLESFFTQLRKLRAAGSLPTKASKDEVYLTIFKASADALVGEALPAFVDAYSKLQLPTNVLDEAAARDFDFSKPDIIRYFVAQAVAEVLTAGLFYQTVRPKFSLKQILSGTRPSTSALMVEVLKGNLDEATRVTGDYETIFGLSAGALWALAIENNSLRTHWVNLFDALAGVKFEEVTSDIIGVIFERLISADRRQDMGQHYTQTRLARAMTAWSVKNPGDTVVDFCAGGGTFLVEAYSRLRESKTHEAVLEQVFGNDLDSFAAHLSTINLATRDVYKGHNFPAVSNRDAFDLRPGDAAVEVTPAQGDAYRVDFPARFDVVVGNPPYDEKADTPEEYRTALAEIAGTSGRSVVPTDMPDTVNLAAWFILLAAAWLGPSGRLALVLPAAILQNEKHATLLRWLRSRYDLSVWHTESDVWFSDARVAPIALFAQPRKVKGTAYGTFEFVNVTAPLTGEMVEVDGFPRPIGAPIIDDLGTLEPEQDALIAGTRPETLRLYEAAPNVAPLKDMSAVSAFRGNKLGHTLYKLKDRDPKSSGLTRSLTGFDIQVRLNKKYLTPLLRSPKDEPSGEFDPEKVNWWILTAPSKLPVGGELEKYVRAAKRAGAANAPSVKAKGKAWWSVSWKTSRVAIAAHPQFQHQMWWSDKPFIATDNVQALGFGSTFSKEDQELVAASLASAFGALSAFYRSNEVGCEGVRWLSTANLEGWFALEPHRVAKEHVKPVLVAYRAYRKFKTAKVFEMPPAAKSAWRDLTVAVAAAAGIADCELLADAALKEANTTTFRRREREIAANSGRTRAGSTGGAKLLRDIKRYAESHPIFLEAVALLSAGDTSVKLHLKEVEHTLFDLDRESEKLRVGNALVVQLGENFDAAPVWGDKVIEKVAELFDAVRRQFMELDQSGAVPVGFEQVAAAINDCVTKSLHGAIRKRLS